MNGASTLGDVPVDQHERQRRGRQLVVALGSAGGVGVQPGDEDDAADLPVEQHLDVLVLGDAAGGLGAQHRGVAAAGPAPTR